MAFQITSRVSLPCSEFSCFMKCYSCSSCNYVLLFINPLDADLNLICHLLALLKVHHIFHVSGLRVKVPALKATFLQAKKNFGPLRFRYKDVSLHNT